MRRTRRTRPLRTLLLTYALLLAAHAAPRAQTAAPPDAPAQTKTQTTPDAGAAQTPAAAPGPDLMLLHVAVTDDYGRFVTGLRRERFSVYDGDAQRELLYFDDAEAPQSVGVVFDVSRSMRDAALDAARNALLRLARQAHQSNEYFIAAFDGRARLLTDWTRDEAKFIKGLNDLARIEDRKSGTALYDALALATEKAARGSQPRRVVILVSDGRDNGSGTKASALREMLRRSGVVLYAVRVVDSNDAVPELDELARGSGGRALFPRTRAELDDSFERIALELHSLYTVGFKSDAADGRWHKLRVKVQPPPKWPRMSARTREGYYAAAAGGN